MDLEKIIKRLYFQNLFSPSKKGLNQTQGDPNYDIKQLSLECASKRMYPDILNYDQVVKVTGSLKPQWDAVAFRCIRRKGHEIHDGRNNLGVVSLNLPRIALESKTKKISTAL